MKERAVPDHFLLSNERAASVGDGLVKTGDRFETAVSERFVDKCPQMFRLPI
jgi:hypothetical protein